jgi:hypothetical protein
MGKFPTVNKWLTVIFFDFRTVRLTFMNACQARKLEQNKIAPFCCLKETSNISLFAEHRANRADGGQIKCLRSL